jgi:RNase P subunit RPR2
MRMHSEKNVMAKHNEMLFSPVKRKRSKRGMPALDSEMCAADALLMLAKYSDKSYGYEDCCGGDNNISTPNLLKEVNLNAFDQLVQSDEFTSNTGLKSDKNSAYEGLYEHTEKESSLNLAADVPRTMVLLNVFDHGLVDGNAEFMKPEADISVGEVKSGNLSFAVNIKRYQCKVCGKLLRSGYSLGRHMRLHCEKENSLNLVADVPKEVLLDVDDAFVKPGAEDSVEEFKSSDLSAAVSIKSYQCKVCGKVLRSGRALGGHMTSHLQHGQENTLNLVADAPEMEALLNVFDHGLDVHAEFMKPGADISVEELKSSVLTAAVNVKRHQCKICGKLLVSGHALGGHMRLHLVRKCNLHQGVADGPNAATMEEQMRKLGLDSPIFYRRRPRSYGRET